MYRVVVSFATLLAFTPVSLTQSSAHNAEFQALQSHFERVVEDRFEKLFHDVRSVPEWEAQKEASKRALTRMLWDERRWPVDPPPAQIVRRQERREYSVENIILETDRGIFSTANLYLPRSVPKPYPVILYQCGHANKAVYKHHGAWFAARGIAVMIMDNIEMGELQFTHHGVYSHAWFHWYSRGFSPLAVELLNARRTLDYLTSRDDLDSQRIGATGRSGGGMATFFLAAIDERIKASAPVSGTLSTPGWVRHRLSSAHCDCQYPVNTHGMMYSEIGALTAPRPQLLCNADADRGFPMDALSEMAGKMNEIYRLYDASDSLRTAVVPGGHKDTEAIRLPVYEFFLEQFLGVAEKIESEGEVDTPEDEDLRCFLDGYPLDERLTRIDEELIPTHPTLPASGAGWSTGESHASNVRRNPAELAELLRREVFRYFPPEDGPLAEEWGTASRRQGRIIRKVSFNSFPDLRVHARHSLPDSHSPPAELPGVLVLDHRKGIPVWGNEQELAGNRWGNRAVLIVEGLDRGSRALEQNLRSFRDDDDLHHMRRQAMVAGTTIESMRVYETLRAMSFLRSQPEVAADNITIIGSGVEGINGLYAAMLDGDVARVVLESPPASHRQGPCYLGILRHTDIPEVVALMRDRVRIYGEIPPSIHRELERTGKMESLIVRSLEESLPED